MKLQVFILIQLLYLCLIYSIFLLFDILFHLVMLIIFFTERERQLNAVIEDPFFMCACPALFTYLFSVLANSYFILQPVESNYILKSMIFFRKNSEKKLI